MLRLFRTLFFLHVAIIFLIAYPMFGQDVGPITIGQRVKFHSDIMKEDKTLWIYTPEPTNAQSSRYPVMYLLDGESNFVHTTGIVQFLSENNRMPGMIVVGVSSTDRTRDFTPNDSSIPGSGGAGRFLRCLKNELIPYIESHYETAPFRLLVGHSLGGSFSTHFSRTRICSTPTSSSALISGGETTHS